MKILIIDHRDSFTYNLVHLFREQGASVKVLSCDEVSESDGEEVDGIVFSPGPGNVLELKDIGNSGKMFDEWYGKKPMLGVCFGHQLFGVRLGCELQWEEPAHGKRDRVEIDPQCILFAGIKIPCEVMRYHSQVIINPPEKLQITAKLEDGTIMAFEDHEANVFGVQFHPESIGTKEGNVIARNFLSRTMKS